MAHSVRIWINRDIFRISSGLAFESIFSIVPLAALGLWFIDAIGQSTHVKALADYIGRQLFPSFGPEAIDMVRKMATRIKGEYLGTVGAVATLLISIMVFLSIEKAFNEIWEERKKRGFFSQFSTYWTLVSLIPLMTLLVFLRRTDFPVISHPWVAHFTVFFMFFLANKLIPNTQVKTSAAILGSLVSTLFFQIARIAFSKYFSSKYFGIYAEIGVLFLMLVWIYYIWLTVLLGAIVAHVFQRFSYLEERRITESRWAVFPGEPLSWRAWSILDFMYHNRELHDTQTVALSLGESPELVELMCKQMEQEDILFRVGERWGLAIEDSRKITVARVAKAFAKPIHGDAGKASDLWQELSDYFMEFGERINLTHIDDFKEIIHDIKAELERDPSSLSNGGSSWTRPLATPDRDLPGLHVMTTEPMESHDDPGESSPPEEAPLVPPVESVTLPPKKKKKKAAKKIPLKPENIIVPK
ncbi:YihY/virulence factor BrkB family protein [Myxococcota bacterium]|nr:YihY/virulence factor BrkB family protein [Myxococcota bacterium]